MEEVAEGLLRFIGSVIRWFVWELIFHWLMFSLGRVFLLLITLGRYPRGYTLERDADKISWVGVLVTVLIWASIALYNNYG